MDHPRWTRDTDLDAGLCQLLPHFEDTSLSNIAADKFRDVAARFDSSPDAQVEAAFRRRLFESSERIMASNAPDGALRVRLWDHLQSAFEIETSLPLSTRVANANYAALAHYAARTLSDLLKPDEETGSLSLPGEAWKRLAALFSKGNPDFMLDCYCTGRNRLHARLPRRPKMAPSHLTTRRNWSRGCGSRLKSCLPNSAAWR